MTFQLTYEELLARNEKLENAVQDAMKALANIEKRLNDEWKGQSSDTLDILDSLEWEVDKVLAGLESAL